MIAAIEKNLLFASEDKTGNLKLTRFSSCRKTMEATTVPMFSMNTSVSITVPPVGVSATNGQRGSSSLVLEKSLIVKIGILSAGGDLAKKAWHNTMGSAQQHSHCSFLEHHILIRQEVIPNLEFVV